MADLVPAHSQAFTKHYVVHYPAHEPRESDPHKRDFLEWKKRRKESGTYHCDFAVDHRNGDFSECDLSRPLEAHHKVIEFAMTNEVDISLLEKDYPGISKEELGAWIDGDSNLTLLCVFHHRGPGGVHNASYSDYGSEFYIRNLISDSETEKGTDS